MQTKGKEVEMKWIRGVKDHPSDQQYLLRTLAHVVATLKHVNDMLGVGNEDGAHVESIKAVKAAIMAVEAASDQVASDPS